MNNLETNALRIIELLYPDIDINGIEKYKEFFSSYQGLMPIVFECNTGDNLFAIRFDEDKVDLLRNNKWIEFDPSDGGLYQVDYEEEPNENFFIEAIQLACIKYLEIKNDNSRIQPTI